MLKNKLRLSKLNTFIPLKAKEAQRVEIECCEASKKVVAVLHDHDLILKRKLKKHWIDSWRGSNIDFPKQWVCEWQSDQTKNIHQKSYDWIPKEGSRAAKPQREVRPEKLTVGLCDPKLSDAENIGLAVCHKTELN